MKHHIWIFLLFLYLCVFSCKESEEYTPASDPTEQDRDNDSITGDDYTYTLPVIFHVLYQNKDSALQYIEHKRLKTILSYVNEIYQGNVYGKSQNIHVNFELATYDEKGNKLSTPGVEYIKYTGTYPIDYNDFMGDDSGKNKSYIWDPNEYINVMLYNFKNTDKNTTTLGISNMPYVASDGYPQLEGLSKVQRVTLTKNNLKYPYCVSINSLYAYNESSRYTDQYKGHKGYTYDRTDVNVTLAHELGHYLGLHHVFTEIDEEIADSCADTDYCDDTPSYNYNEYTDWVKYFVEQKHEEKFTVDTLTTRTNCDGELWRSANLMDYSYCYSDEFTEDQLYRIRQVLYYSPLIPGPKKARPNSAKSRASEQLSSDEPLDLPIRLAKCVIRRAQHH